MIVVEPKSFIIEDGERSLGRGQGINHVLARLQLHIINHLRLLALQHAYIVFVLNFPFNGARRNSFSLLLVRPGAGSLQRVQFWFQKN